VQSWKKRFFVLLCGGDGGGGGPPSLAYWRDSADPLPIATIPLRPACYRVTTATALDAGWPETAPRGQLWFFKLVPLVDTGTARTWMLAAPSESEMHHWVGALARACGRPCAIAGAGAGAAGRPHSGT
jgi:hypothetical protein